jgi:hypothetical protein
MTRRHKTTPLVPLTPRHRRTWQTLWRRCSCGLTTPCVDRLVPARVPPFPPRLLCPPARFLPSQERTTHLPEERIPSRNPPPGRPGAQPSGPLRAAVPHPRGRPGSFDVPIRTAQPPDSTAPTGQLEPGTPPSTRGFPQLNVQSSIHPHRDTQPGNRTANGGGRRHSLTGDGRAVREAGPHDVDAFEKNVCRPRPSRSTVGNAGPNSGDPSGKNAYGTRMRGLNVGDSGSDVGDSGSDVRDSGSDVRDSGSDVGDAGSNGVGACGNGTYGSRLRRTVSGSGTHRVGKCDIGADRIRRSVTNTYRTRMAGTGARSPARADPATAEPAAGPTSAAPSPEPPHHPAGGDRSGPDPRSRWATGGRPAMADHHINLRHW